MMRYTTTVLLAILTSTTEAFVSPLSSSVVVATSSAAPSTSSALHALDPVTYLRTEWVSAALCTNQTPRSADIALQLGSEDGRIVNFVPRTIRRIITSSAEPLSSTNSDSNDERPLTVSCERQLTQQAERRNTAAIQFSNQPADNLKDTPDASVDVVVSFQAAQRMYENGLDFKKSIREAGRVLKPGGRFLFVESAEVGGESYLECVKGMSGLVSGGMGDEYNEEIVVTEQQHSATETALDDADDTEENEEEAKPPLFEEVGYDNVDMVLQPHIAGIAIKAMDADMTMEERKQMKSQEEEDRLAEMSFAAFERGNKRRKRKKKKAGMGMGSE
mmetsp:Transcript_2601/g.4428  ORF Transcript_2601/g.4428 Transcript_2601/m.4428 type:complete len:332 (-) Transcript_2601:802-1797(-)